MKAVIFSRGDCFRLTAQGQAVPKPMVLIGQRPVLWHVMRAHAAWSPTISSSAWGVVVT